jgi:hypothetical protein
MIPIIVVLSTSDCGGEMLISILVSLSVIFVQSGISIKNVEHMFVHVHDVVSLRHNTVTHIIPADKWGLQE